MAKVQAYSTFYTTPNVQELSKRDISFRFIPFGTIYKLHCLSKRISRVTLHQHSLLEFSKSWMMRTLTETLKVGTKKNGFLQVFPSSHGGPI